MFRGLSFPLRPLTVETHLANAQSGDVMGLNGDWTSGYHKIEERNLDIGKRTVSAIITVLKFFGAISLPQTALKYCKYQQHNHKKTYQDHLLTIILGVMLKPIDCAT